MPADLEALAEVPALPPEEACRRVAAALDVPYREARAPILHLCRLLAADLGRVAWTSYTLCALGRLHAYQRALIWRHARAAWDDQSRDPLTRRGCLLLLLEMQRHGYAADPRFNQELLDRLTREPDEECRYYIASHLLTVPVLREVTLERLAAGQAGPWLQQIAAEIRSYEAMPWASVLHRFVTEPQNRHDLGRHLTALIPRFQPLWGRMGQVFISEFAGAPPDGRQALLDWLAALLESDDSLNTIFALRLLQVPEIVAAAASRDGGRWRSLLRHTAGHAADGMTGRLARQALALLDEAPQRSGEPEVAGETLRGRDVRDAPEPLRIDGRQDLLLLALYAPGREGWPGEGVQGMTRLQKLLFLMQKEAGLENLPPTGTEGYRFRPFDYGPFTPEIYEDIDVFEQLGIVKVEPAPHMEDPDARVRAREALEGKPIPAAYHLTDPGRQLAERLRRDVPHDVWIKVVALKREATGTPLKAFLRRVYQDHPQYAVRSKILRYLGLRQEGGGRDG